MKVAPNGYQSGYQIQVNRGSTIVLYCVVPAAMLYWLTAMWPDTPDGWLHLQRVRALTDALRMGKLLPRWLPDFSFGYGYPVFNFYASAFYYPPALLRLAGVEIVAATRITLAIAYGLSGLAMALLLRQVTTPLPTFIGTVTYLLFPYRFYDLFVRGALPEFVAFLWPPLILYFSYQAFQSRIEASNNAANHGGGRSRDVTILASLIAPALCWAGLILTHNLTALMLCLVMVAAIPVISGWLVYTDAAAFSLKGYGKALWQVGWRLCVPIGLGAFLCAWYWLPALVEARWVGIGASDSSYGFLNHLVDWSALLTWSPFYLYPEPATATVPLPGWLLFVLLAAISVLLFPRWIGSRRMGKGRGWVYLSLLLSTMLLLCTIWLTMRYSEALWRWAVPVLGKLQFPWRWQTLVALATGASVAMLWSGFSPRLESTFVAPGTRGVGKRPHILAAILSGAVALYLLIYAMVGLVTPTGMAATTQMETSTAAMWAMDAKNGQVGASWTAEFLPIWVTEQRWAIGRAPSDGTHVSASPALAMRVWPQQIGYDQALYRVSAQQAGSLALHRFYYPAWQVTLDGAPIATTPVTNLGLLAFDVAAGEHLLEVSWRPTSVVWVGRAMALVGWLAILVVLLARPKQWWRILIWMVVGLVMVSIAASVGAKRIHVTEINADFGDMFLGGADIQPARAGEVAAVRLHWFVRASAEPVNAYVHVLAADGQVIAQQDGPVAGDYMPAERWLPGLIFDNTHLIPLPSELPPGSYQVVAGLYPAGQPDSPLIADGATGARVAIGVLEVRP